MKTIAIYNNKGGCGKTVTAVNMAYNLTAMGWRTLVIDMDPQGNASSFFRRYDLFRPSVMELLTGRLAPSRCIYRTVYPMLDIIQATDPFIAMLDKKQKLLVDALTALISSMERQTLSEEEERQEQPELPALKNNDQRKRFLETFREWPVWFEVPQAAEVYYRYDLPVGCSLVICEYHYWASWKVKYGYGGEPECTGTREYLLTPEYHYLEDCKISRTAMIEKLKEIQKGGKERECRD